MSEFTDPAAADALGPDALDRAAKELAADRRTERLLLWKGLLALLFVVAVAYLRNRYFL